VNYLCKPLQRVKRHQNGSRGPADFRPHAQAQFLPLVLIPLILLMFGSALTRAGYVWAILVTYAAA